MSKRNKKRNVVKNRVITTYRVNTQKMWRNGIIQAVIGFVLVFVVLFVTYPYVKVSFPRLPYCGVVGLIMALCLLLNTNLKSAKVVQIRENTAQVIEYEFSDKRADNKGRKIKRQYDVIHLTNIKKRPFSLILEGKFYEYGGTVKVDRIYDNEDKMIQDLMKIDAVIEEDDEDEE